ncbi:hypothetical protein ANANG_G00292700 [Anguilla anguilla]|uniref:F-box and WD repeat domain containing 9 n=1 Tax=Anguilla anguilla TaxID=7936 RepID=A0A9D3RLZ9_ANGAN|nr:hypothetical protein ANANG_G00292700 [Anguilla anguilla]
MSWSSSVHVMSRFALSFSEGVWMSEAWGRREEEEAEAELSELKAGSAVGRAGHLAPLNLPQDQALRPDQQNTPLHPPGATRETSPSPSSEGTGLSSPGGVGEDSTAWQLRARRLIGPGASFPVGPREGFDWPTACLEMEELISCWAGLSEKEREGQGQEAGPAGDRGAGLQEAGEAAVAREPGAEGGRAGDGEMMEGGGLLRFSLPSGHIAEVNTVLLVGGGALCASGSRDRNHAPRLGVVPGGPRPLLCSGSFDSTVRLWDLGAGGTERGLIQARAAVLCLSCQSDALLAGSYDKKVSIYDTRAAEPLVKSLRLHGNAVLCLAADEQYILSGSKDRTLAVFDRRAGKPLQKLSLSSYLLSMSYSGKEVWAGDNHGMIHTFGLRDGLFQPVSHFDVGHHSLVTGIHNSAGTLYTCSSDRTIKIHLPSAPPRTLCSLRHQAGVNGLSVEGGVLAVASGDMCVEVWRPQR